jgi:spore coat polysaccharide biosynthesis protein SpsF (cytidylyltransferase family)
MDPAIVEHAVSLWEPGVIVTNVRPRSFPTGQSVEVFELAALEAAERTPQAREHVTPELYEWLEVRNFSHEPDVSHVRLTLDTAEDAAFLASLFARMDRPAAEYGLEEVLALCSA